MTEVQEALIDSWFPVAAVDEACGTPAGSGLNEKAIFTWFASRPIAQARAAVLCSLIPNGDDDEELHGLVERAVRTGASDALEELAKRIPDVDGKPPVVLDCFSGRGIIPLEAARIGLRSVGIDLSPVATLGSRLLSDYSLRDWSSEPDVPFDVTDASSDGDSLFDATSAEPKLVRDLRALFAEIGRRVESAIDQYYPRNADGSRPWGYLWATTIPCDNCNARFPLVGSLVLRHPYRTVRDPGQYFSIEVDKDQKSWHVSVHDGVPSARPTFVAAPGKRGKSARCPFCEHVHPLEAVKTKGFADQYRDALIAVAELSQVEVVDDRGRTRTVERKVFRVASEEEHAAALAVDLATQQPFGALSAAPIESIAPGNRHSVRGTAYGLTTFADLMGTRQCLQFIETVRAIRACRSELSAAGVSNEYAACLSGFASANLVRRLRRATRGVSVAPRGKPDGSEQNRTYTTDLFANESAVGFSFDWFETGPGEGPGTWTSLTETTLTPLDAHLRGLGRICKQGTFRQASATALPYRDASIDAVVCDPPYYSMIDYADVSDLFYVWLRRCLFDIIPDLFGTPGDTAGLQNKSQEIIVKDSGDNDHRTKDWYEKQLSKAFTEIRRVLKPGGTLTVVFGHSDPAAWRRLLGALRDAGFVVTSAWPARTESANTGVASIKVTVTIGCKVAPDGRKTETAAVVEREIVELIRKRVPKWDAWGLALSDQLMAAYGPAMQVVGGYRSILQPDGSEPDLDHFLTVGRRAVQDAHAFKIDELPLETFDAETRFSLFWMRAHQRSPVAKSEAVFEAQAANMRLDDVRGTLLTEAKGGYVITLDAPPPITDRSPVIHVARALGAGWSEEGTEGAAQIVADSGRAADDQHLWATVGELVRQLPESDRLCKSLTDCQRNRPAIENAARHQVAARDAADQPTLDLTGGVG